MSDGSLSVTPICCGSDNYVWLFETTPGIAAVVDPGEADAVRDALDGRALSLGTILLTHHHADHVGGVAELVAAYHPEIIGGAHEAALQPLLTRRVEGGERLALGDLTARVIAVPGHTRGHVAYLVADALFSGDALFSFGCGRLFEGSAAEGWTSLLRLRALSDDVRLFCGHEYTEANLRFALDLEPGSDAIADALGKARVTGKLGKPTLPASLGREKRLNPFLRCDDPAFARALGLESLPPEEVFAAIRARKDSFR